MKLSILLLAFLSSQLTLAQKKSSKVDSFRFNQLGFYESGKKVAAVIDAPYGSFFIVSTDFSDTLFSGPVRKQEYWKYSGELVNTIDFSRLKTKGEYRIAIPDFGYSETFKINNNIHNEVSKASIKALYYNRVSMPIKKEFGGKWARPAGHPDNEVYIHPSAISPGRPAESTISTPGGWYDAGDYGKYIVNSGISTYTLLAAYEHFSSYYDTLNLNIPESGNAVPDILDEALYNIRWMMTMQDPSDGGVYNKCTHANFQGMVMPNVPTDRRWVVQKGTAATLDFAAVTACAYRIFKKYEKEFPGLADSLLKASEYAWQWAKKNPAVSYDQNANNEVYKPAVVTGGYPDVLFHDEFFWAASELYIATKSSDYKSEINFNKQYSIPGWPKVGALGYQSLAFNNVEKEAAVENILRLADKLVESINETPYKTPFGRYEWDFVWGSNSGTANQAILLLQAYEYTNDKKYLEAANANVDYIFGRNATSYSFVTGFGHKPPMHIHHRPSEADGVIEPVPGFLTGGPHNTHPQDCGVNHYPSTLPASAYVDETCSYATNEIAINWNAPLIYITGALEYFRNK